MTRDDRERAVPMGATDRIPHDPGLYIVYSDSGLPGLTWSPASGPLYVGKADDGLQCRIGREHGGDTGRSTLRRSLAALLKEELDLIARCRPTKGEPKPINFTNFSVEPQGDLRLSGWMADHLTVAVLVGAAASGRESALIAELEPLLNLRGWANPWGDVVSRARAECAVEARNRYYGVS